MHIQVVQTTVVNVDETVFVTLLFYSFFPFSTRILVDPSIAPRLLHLYHHFSFTPRQRAIHSNQWQEAKSLVDNHLQCIQTSETHSSPCHSEINTSDVFLLILLLLDGGAPFLDQSSCPFSSEIVVGNVGQEHLLELYCVEETIHS